MNKEVRIDSESANEAVTFNDVKSYGKIPGTAEEGTIMGLIKAVRQLQEQWTGRSFIGKTITVNWQQIPGGQLDLPFGPIRSITSIKRVYEDGTLSDALVEATDYWISGMDFKQINLYKRWQSAGKIVTGIRATYVAGHGDQDGQVELPAPIRSALLRHVVTDANQRDDLEVYQPTLYDWTKEALAPFKIADLWL